MTRRLIAVAAIALTTAVGTQAQRATDALDRGLVAVKTQGGVFCSWRITGEEYYDVAYNLYRDGVKLNDQPLQVSNFLDSGGTDQSHYEVRPVTYGTEQATGHGGSATPWAQSYLEIRPTHEGLQSAFEPNDACAADLDGDGQLELVVKMWNQSDAARGYLPGGYNGEYDVIEMLRLDGTRLWWIDCGPNLADFQHNETNCVAYDWDGDGRAEVLMRAADGTVIHAADGQTYTIGNPQRNYRASGGSSGQWFVHEGDEFLVYMDGLTGKPYQILEYPLRRLEPGETDLNAAWGDGYGHRSTKHFFGAPCLDGRHASIFLARGIYTRHKMVALDVNPNTHELTERWRWNCNDASSPWYGNGYHNYIVADVDWDGRDEIVFGSMVIDDNGHGLSTTGLGHGDAQHCGDFNPYVHGQEMYACNEDLPDNNYRDATTSKIYYRKTSNSDDGRAMCGNFTNDFPGAMGYSGHDTPISCVANDHVDGLTSTGVTLNFRIYWDGDLCEESFNGTGTRNSRGAIYKYGQALALESLDGSLTNNDTKATPCLQADLLGDWREEVVMRTADNNIRIYTTTATTPWRNYTLWHDMQYRQAMVWQMCGYNQPPHTSYFLGEMEGITVAPPPLMQNGRMEVADGGTIGNTDTPHPHWLIAGTQDMTVNVTDGCSPAIVTDNAPSWVQGHDDNDQITTEYYTHTLTGGAFGGDMRLVKQGDGTLVLPNVVQKYTGPTDVWAGTLRFDGTLEQSHVWLNRFAALDTDGGHFPGGIEMDYGSVLRPGGAGKAGTVEVGQLTMNFGSRLQLDVYADMTADQLTTSRLQLNTKDWKHGPKYLAPVIEIVPHYADGATQLPEGRYLIAEAAQVEGSLDSVILEGVSGQKTALVQEGGHIYLEVVKLRDPGDIVWNGSDNGIWDFAQTSNFTVGGSSDIFVTGDVVTFDDSSQQTHVNVTEEVRPGKVIFANDSKDYTLSGDGTVGGNGSMEFNGKADVSILNVNTFSGGALLKSGRVLVSALGNADGVEHGALGGTDNVITLNGGTLATTGSLVTTQPIQLDANGGSIETTGTMTVNTGIRRKSVAATPALHKRGTGTLTLGTGNQFSALYVDEGVVNLREAGNQMSVPDTIVFNGTNVTVADENNLYTYSTNRANYRVPEGKSGNLYLDGRCSYSGRLYGKGTLNVFATNVRNDLTGNWSAFEGTVVAQHSGSSYEFRWFNTYGLPKGTLNIATGTEVNGESRSYTLGNLSGGGTLRGTGTITIGSLNEDIGFTGSFAGSVKLKKVGSGKWTFTKALNNVSEYTFNGGDIVLNNSGTSPLLGTGTITLGDSAALCGNGYIQSARFNSGARLRPGNYTSSRRYGLLAANGSVFMYPGSSIDLIAYSAKQQSTARSYLQIGGELRINGELNIELGDSYTPAAGDTIVFWTAGSVSGTPTAIHLPDLSAYGLAWDTSDLLTPRGVLRVVKATAIGRIPADQTVVCTLYATGGQLMGTLTCRRGEVAAQARRHGLPRGTYVVVVSGTGQHEQIKIVIP